MSENVKIRIEIPEWDNLSRPIKSLVSQFMKNAALIFRGEYQDGQLQYVSGNIRSKYMSLFDVTDTFDNWCCSYELNIPYFNYDINEEQWIESKNELPNGSTRLDEIVSFAKNYKLDKSIESKKLQEDKKL